MTVTYVRGWLYYNGGRPTAALKYLTNTLSSSMKKFNTMLLTNIPLRTK